MSADETLPPTPEDLDQPDDAETYPADVDPDDLRPFSVDEQGDFHVEMVTLADRSPRFRRWYIQTEQKRPGGWSFVIDRTLYVYVNARSGDDGPTLHLREGETGERSTALSARLPRTLPWRQWETLVTPDKWGVEVLVYSTAWPQPGGPVQWLRVRREDRRRQRQWAREQRTAPEGDHS